ncbi:uncharacterized protein TNCV_2312381 [Trichonephila clavipes]|nr:uncharacterized protein TNCV_2312381 [Trichonephila clavipes]
MNFECEVILSPDGQWGSRDENGTWNGIVGLMQSGKADFAMAALGIIKERREDIDFPLLHGLLEKIFATKEPGGMPKITAFTYPFTLSAWILYVLMTSTAAVLFQRMIFKNSTLMGSCISVLGSIVSQAMENITETLGEGYSWVYGCRLLLSCLSFTTSIFCPSSPCQRKCPSRKHSRSCQKRF